MNRRWLRSRWLWLVICVVAGALAFTIPSLQALHQAMQVADALSTGIRSGLTEAGFGGPTEESHRVSVSFLFGLVEVEDTPYPYVWSAIGGIVTGGGVGLIAWGLLQGGMVIWRRVSKAPPSPPGPPSEQRPA